MSDEILTQQPKKRRGCLFYGCLTCIVLMVLALVLVFAAIQVVKKQIFAWTEPDPMQMPRVEMTDVEFQSLQQRAKLFQDAMDQGKPGEPLVLNEREVNALIAKAPKMAEFAGKIYVSLTNDHVNGQVSIPVPRILWFARNRYFNGDATFKVSLENGELTVLAEEMKIKGRALPEPFMNALRQENLAKEVAKDPQKAEFIRKLDSVHVQDSTVIIKAHEAK